MTLDDSLRGVLTYALKVGWPHDRKEELRMVYRKAERDYEKLIPMPAFTKDNPTGYQAVMMDWLVRREIYAAQKTREAIK